MASRTIALVSLRARSVSAEPSHSGVGCKTWWPSASNRGRKSSIGSSGRRRRVLSRIRHALTTMRWSQVESREPWSKRSSARQADRNPSWTASRASSSSRRKRRATARSRPP